jgi:hypothetical protein
MKAITPWAAAAALAVVGTALAYGVGWNGRSAGLDPDRPDCPGRIICPLTDEPVCIDRCPVAAGEVEGAEAVPPCCKRSE